MRDPVSRFTVERLIASLRLRQLQVLNTLADTGNMRAAGQRLNMSASAVSKSLRETEELFAQQIFRRLPHGMVVTAAGDLIVQRARHLLLEVCQLSDDLFAQGNEGREQLVIGAPPFVAWTWLPRLLAWLGERFEGGSVRIVEGRLAEMARQFDAGDIDLLLTMDAPSELGGLKPGGYVVEPVATEEWKIVASPGFAMPDHGRDRLARVPWDRLREVDWILPPRPTNARLILETMMHRQGLPPIVPKFETLNAITNVRLAEEGLGLTLLADSVVRSRIESGTLVSVSLREPFPLMRIVLIYRHAEATRPGVFGMRSAAQALYREAASDPQTSSLSRNPLPDRRSRP